jgi:Uma2 family endonuclease
MATPRRDRVTLSFVSWRDYRHFLRLFSERSAWRLTYDRGILEILAPRENFLSRRPLLSRCIYVLTEELNLPMCGGGATSLYRRKIRRGLDPDECFWFANEHEVRGKGDLDLEVDMPPDLCIETTGKASRMNRMAIYAALGVPEVWQFDEETLSFQVLAGKRYENADFSSVLPLLTPAVLLEHMELRQQLDDSAIAKRFQSWLRRFVGGVPPS